MTNTMTVVRIDLDLLFFILCKDRYYKLVKLQEDEKKIMKEENK